MYWLPGVAMHTVREQRHTWMHFVAAGVSALAVLVALTLGTGIINKLGERTQILALVQLFLAALAALVLVGVLCIYLSWSAFRHKETTISGMDVRGLQSYVAGALYFLIGSAFLTIGLYMAGVFLYATFSN